MVCAPPPAPWPPPPLILEHWKIRRWLFLGAGRLGDAAVLWGETIMGRSQLGNTAQLGATRLDLSRAAVADPFNADAYAFTCLDFEKSAARFGKLGGFAHLKTLIDRLRSDVGAGRSLLLDGGDLWQGTGQANTMQGADMVEAANLLGIEAMTGHWEFTYGETALRNNLARFKGEFLAQNVFLTEEAAFNDAKAFDPASRRVFKPATIKELGGHRVAVIGQAFPYVPIAHPKRFTRVTHLLHPKFGRLHRQHRDPEQPVRVWLAVIREPAVVGRHIAAARSGASTAPVNRPRLG